MIVALAGQKIDRADDPLSRFPLSQRWVVRCRLDQFFKRTDAISTLVCSGVCGADLLALETAGNLGWERVMVLPEDIPTFKEKMVRDRPGDWEKDFDRVYEELHSKGKVLTIPGAATDDQGMLDALWHAVLQEAARLSAAAGGAAKPTALLVWECSKEQGDPLNLFKDIARGKPLLFNIEEIPTDITPGAKAQQVLNEGADGKSYEEVINLYQELDIVKGFNYARRILAIVRLFPNLKSGEKLTLGQKYSLSTYKDVDLPVELRLDEALRVLRQIADYSDIKFQGETFAMMGSVYKRKWEVNGQAVDLDHSYTYYTAGAALKLSRDWEYKAVNAAFILDLKINNIFLANDAKKIGELQPDQQQLVGHYKDEAKQFREQARASLDIKLKDPKANEWNTPQDLYWPYVVLAEAYFGLQQYNKAEEWLGKAMQLGSVPDWQLESTTKQLARLALLQPDLHEGNIRDTQPWNTLKVLVGSDEDSLGALKTAFLGKVGLALSGGGFRAALYHIGVLARLAELDMLRNVEVLSCVSGGSIIGAHYYLELKNLLEDKSDDSIEKDDYIRIVERISKDFLAGVQRNLRMRVISNWWDNSRLFWDKQYSRSRRLGSLYERELFCRVRGYDKKKPIMLNELKVYPKGKDGLTNKSFNPKLDNWRRRAKVPILLLNATTVNTGHNWQFSASWMGESPFAIQAIDGNARLRRMYYEKKGEVQYRREMRLGHAVAASSAVPGLFDPLKLDSLYPGYKVALVDGGVHDNQGVAGLLEQDCTVMLVSDASGQMVTIAQVSDNPLAVPLRANDILMERVRNAEYQELSTRRRAGLLKGFMFIHLKMDLEVTTVDWVHCDDPQDSSPLDNQHVPLTSYHIRKDLQRKLSNIRTDLDSFHDIEAYALMTSGYLMTERQYADSIQGFSVGHAEKRNWDFLVMQQDLGSQLAPDRMIHLLDVAGNMLFKTWDLDKRLKWTAKIFRVLAVAAVILLFVLKWNTVLTLPVSKLGIMLGTFVLGLFINQWFIKLAKFRETILRVLIMTGLVTVLWGVVWLHLSVFDRLYLKLGRLVRRSSP